MLRIAIVTFHASILRCVSVVVAMSLLALRYSSRFVFDLSFCSYWPEFLVLPLEFSSVAYSIMAQMPIWRQCWSTYNLHSFQIWFEHYASEAEQQSVLGLYLVEHREGPSPLLDRLGLVPQTIPVTLKAGGREYTLPTRLCEEVSCTRCLHGRGGYQFRWVDDRWTPRAALDLSLSPQEVLNAMRSPWPRGSRTIPPNAPPRVTSPAVPTSSEGPACYRLRIFPQL